MQSWDKDVPYAGMYVLNFNLMVFNHWLIASVMKVAGLPLPNSFLIYYFT